MSNFKANISTEAILNQMANLRNSSSTQTNTFNPKRYLNTRLNKDEQSKTLVVRVLPFDAESGDNGVPMFNVHMHNIQVSKDVTPSGWKMIPCPRKNGFDKECPICELATEAYNKSLEAGKTTELGKTYMDVAKANFTRSMWVVRCIERGHEEDGVKFWLFNNRSDGQGVRDKLLALMQARAVKIEPDGKPYNVFSLDNGKDLIVTIGRDSQGKSVINITDSDERSPLSEDIELGNSWIQDETKWDDLYKVKSYDYLAILAQGGVPYYSKKQGKYLEKEEVLAELKGETEAKVEQPTKDYSKVETVAVQAAATPSLPQVEAFSSAIEDDDLPF